jgi:hypothetical protein
MTAPAPPLKELKRLVKGFYDKIPKAKASKATLHSWANEIGLSQLPSVQIVASNKADMKNKKDLLKPVVNLLPDNTHQAPELPLHPKSVAEPKKTAVSKPENLRNYRNLHAESHKTVIIPGLSLQHLEDAQYHFNAIQREDYMPVSVTKHISEVVKNLGKLVDSKSPHHAEVIKHLSKLVDSKTPHKEVQHKDVQAKPVTAEVAHQYSNVVGETEHIEKMEAERKKYLAYIKAQKEGGKTHKEANAMWKEHKKLQKK